MRLCYISKPCIGQFTSSDAIYHVPYSLARRWDLVLISSSTCADRPVHGFLESEIVVPSAKFWSWDVWKALRQMHRDQRFDVILSGIDEASFLPACLGSRLWGIPWICICEDHPFQGRYAEAGPLRQLERALRVWLLKRLLPRASRLIYFISPGVLGFLKLKGVREAHLTNGCDLEAIAPIREAANSLQPSRGLTLGYVGVVSRRKGAFTMIQIIKRVRDVIPDARLQLIGRLESGEEQLILNALSDPDLTDAVELTGQWSSEEALRKAAHCDICLHAYSAEPWLYWNQPLKICEYLALGKPVVAIDHPGVRDLIEDRVSGMLGRSSDEMAERVLELAADADLRNRIASGADERAEALSWSRLELRLYGIIEQCLKPC